MNRDRGIDVILESEPNFEQSQQIDFNAVNQVLHTEEPVSKVYRTEVKKPEKAVNRPQWTSNLKDSP